MVPVHCRGNPHKISQNSHSHNPGESESPTVSRCKTNSGADTPEGLFNTFQMSWVMAAYVAYSSSQEIDVQATERWENTVLVIRKTVQSGQCCAKAFGGFQSCQRSIVWTARLGLVLSQTKPRYAPNKASSRADWKQRVRVRRVGIAKNVTGIFGLMESSLQKQTVNSLCQIGQIGCSEDEHVYTCTCACTSKCFIL